MLIGKGNDVVVNLLLLFGQLFHADFLLVGLIPYLYHIKRGKSNACSKEMENVHILFVDIINVCAKISQHTNC